MTAATAAIDYSLEMLFSQPAVSSPAADTILVSLIVRKIGVLAGQQKVRLQFFVSPDNVLDAADLKIVDRELVFDSNLAATGLNVSLNLRPSAIARGAFSLIARIDPGNLVAESNESNNSAMILGSAAGTDAVLEWISTALSAVMCEGQAGRGVGPTTGTRLMAMLSTAIYDTVCGFNNTQTPYSIDRNAPAGASLQAAVIGAASRILTQSLPGQSAFLTAQTNTSLAKLGPLNSTIQAGLTFGGDVAQSIMALRAADGSDNNAPYVPAVRADGYVWKPQLTGPTAGVALGPNWGSVTPFVISNVQGYVPTLEARPDRNPTKYAQELEEVRLYGALSNTSKTTVLRTADQTQIAKFWAYDRPDTYRPYGQLNQIAVDVSLKSGGLSIQTNAALFAALNVALADAVIVAWRAKYSEAQPRPADLITGQVVNAMGVPVAPVVDTQWKSLLSEINGVQSPPFPDFLSGHSAMGGVFASVMTKYFGNRTFDAFSQEMPWSPSSQGIKRTFTGFMDNNVFRNGFYQAGLENALSRIYGGVHIREACLDSFAMGQQVGDFVAHQALFQPV